MLAAVASFWHCHAVLAPPCRAHLLSASTHPYPSPRHRHHAGVQFILDFWDNLPNVVIFTQDDCLKFTGCTWLRMPRLYPALLDWESRWVRVRGPCGRACSRAWRPQAVALARADFSLAATRRHARDACLLLALPSLTPAPLHCVHRPAVPRAVSAHLQAAHVPFSRDNCFCRMIHEPSYAPSTRYFWFRWMSFLQEQLFNESATTRK